MNSLVWQSVMWRPGKGRFLIGMKNPSPIPAGRNRQTTRPLAGPRRSPDSQRQSGYALPFRHASGDILSSRSPLCSALPRLECCRKLILLPHLICSRPMFFGGVKDEADQHGDL
jgi:hypothetical protein